MKKYTCKFNCDYPSYKIKQYHVKIKQSNQCDPQSRYCRWTVSIVAKMSAGSERKLITNHIVNVKNPCEKKTVFATVLSEFQGYEPFVFDFEQYLERAMPEAVQAFEDGDW